MVRKGLGWRRIGSWGSGCDGRLHTEDKMAKRYTVSEGKMTLKIQDADEGGFIVTSPFHRGLISPAETLAEAFEMARDALNALVEARRKPILAARPRGRRQHRHA